MKAKSVISLFALLLAAFAQAQTFSISDSEGIPLPFAHVLVEDVKASKSLQLQSDQSGLVAIPAEFQAPGNYRIFTSYLGFFDLDDTVQNLSAYQVKMISDPVSLDPFVVTAQYGQARADNSIHKIKVITPERIEQQGAVSLEDLLSNETNIRIGQDNILGSSMSMQGISGQNVKILIDGVPVIGRLDGNIDLSQINLNDIERIEVVEGPLSVNFGTDALAGTINLITKKDQSETWKLDLNSYYESAGQYNLDAKLGYKLKGNPLSVSFGRYYFDGWDPDDDFIQFPKETPADTNRFIPWNPKEQYFSKIQYAFSKDKITIRPYAEYYQEKITNRGKPRKPYYETALDDYYYTYRANAGVDVNAKISNVGKVQVLAAYNHYSRIKNTYFVDLSTLDQVLSESSGAQDTTRFNTFMSRANFVSLRDSAILNYELGYDLNHETAEGRRLENRSSDQGDYALYGTLVVQASSALTFKPGLRIAYNTKYDAPITPSINALYKLGDFTLRASYARGFRAPGMKELYFEFVDINHNILGNEDLSAERSNNYLASLAWKKLRNQNLYKVSLDAYYNDLWDRITLVQVGNSQQFTYENIGRYKTTGIQANAELIRQDLNIALGVAYNGRYNVASEDVDVDPFSFSPELRANVNYTIPRTDVKIAAFYKYNGELNGFRINSEEEIIQTSVAAYNMLDLSATRLFWAKRLSATIGAKNLFNIRDIAVNQAGGAHSGGGEGTSPLSYGTTLFASLKFNFNW